MSTGQNRVTCDNDPTAHAEVVVIRAACLARRDYSLTGSTLYASCGPCPLCVSAALWAGLTGSFTLWTGMMRRVADSMTASSTGSSLAAGRAGPCRSKRSRCPTGLSRSIPGWPIPAGLGIPDQDKYRYGK
jgi:hypothetical protein